MVTPLLGVLSTQHGPYSTLRLDIVWLMTSKFCEVLIQCFEAVLSSLYSGDHINLRQSTRAVGQACSSLMSPDPIIEGLVIQKVWHCWNVDGSNQIILDYVMWHTFGNFAI